MDKKKSFVFNIEWQEVLMDYPAEVRLEVYDAIIEYAASGTLLDMKPLAKMAFSFIKRQIDYNNQRYNDTIEKRRESGRRGGEANASKPKQSVANEANASKPKQSVANEANASKPKQSVANEANASKPKQSVANEADIVIDNDNDIVIDNYYPPLPPLGETAEENNPANEVEETLNPSKIPKPRKKEKEKSSAKKEKELTYPYQSERFMAAWNNLLLCPKWRKKLPYTLQLALNKLAKYEEEFAIRQMDLAAMNDWQGIVFQDTDEKYQKYLAEKQGSYKHPATNFKNDVEYTIF